MKKELVVAGLVTFFAMFGIANATEVMMTSPSDNLALYADVSQSDWGWGGGWNKADITDGWRVYPGEWARGLAFRYGGWYQLTIDFGHLVTFDRIIQWYHGGMNNNEAAAYKFQYFTGTSWMDFFETDNSHAYLKYPDAGDTDWWRYWSTPYENTFAPVVSDKLRILTYPLNGSHVWLYEVEVYGPTHDENPSATPEPSTMLLLGIGLTGMSLIGRNMRMEKMS